MKHRHLIHAAIASALLCGCATLPSLPPDALLVDAPDSCVNPLRIESFQYLGRGVLLVTERRKHYRLETAVPCPELGYVNTVRFNFGPGPLCGNARDAVVTSYRTCPIARVQQISSAQRSELVDIWRGRVTSTESSDSSLPEQRKL